MHQPNEDMPVLLSGGGLSVRSVRTQSRKGLPDDLCSCPHWGYIIEGSIHCRLKGQAGR